MEYHHIKLEFHFGKKINDRLLEAGFLLINFGARFLLRWLFEFTLNHSIRMKRSVRIFWRIFLFEVLAFAGQQLLQHTPAFSG